VATTPQERTLIENRNLCHWLQQVKICNKYLTITRKVTKKITKAAITADWLKHWTKWNITTLFANKTILASTQPHSGVLPKLTESEYHLLKLYWEYYKCHQFYIKYISTKYSGGFLLAVEYQILTKSIALATTAYWLVPSIPTTRRETTTMKTEPLQISIWSSTWEASNNVENEFPKYIKLYILHFP